MVNCSEKIMMEFETNADKLFTFLFKQFESNTQQLNRQEDENVFLRSAARYADTFKEQLNQHALELIEKYRHSITDLAHVQQMLTKRITFYINDFNQKAKQ